VASRDGYITGMYSRGDLRQREHDTAKLMGIIVSELEKN
jgi:hypothetical protein